MKTLKELDNHLYNQEGGNPEYYQGYKNAIIGIYEDIKNSSSLSLKDIEKYLEDLINK